MNKIFLLTLSFILMSGVAFAAAKHKVAYKTMRGSVKTVTLADSSKGTMSEVTVADEKSGEKNFLVKTTTTIWSKDFKAIGLDRINPNDRIKVKYTTTKEGVAEAVSINIFK
jgi:hypothetical protein